MLPDWIISINDNHLRAAFAEVWARLPEYVKPALEIDRPGVHLVDKLDTAAGTQVWVSYETGKTSLMMFFRRDVLDNPPAALRSLVAHELTHVYLRHHDHLLSKSHRDPAPEIKAFQEWHADFCAMYLFGFKDDFLEARNAYLAEHPELPAPAGTAQVVETVHGAVEELA